MLFLTPLFDYNSYLVKSGQGKQSIYKGNRILLARIHFSQFIKAQKLELLRLEKGSKNIYVLDRRNLRAMHGKNKIKKLYLKFCKTGKVEEQKKIIIQEAPPIGIFAMPVVPVRTIISDFALARIKASVPCREALQNFHKITSRSLRNWFTDNNPMLTTPDALQIISSFTNLTPELILKKVSQ